MSLDRRLLLMHPDDDCVILRTPVAAGETLLIEGQPACIASAVPMGHKLARRAIAAGEKVRRYGAVIGTATQPIAAGELIHLHNLASDYVPTHLGVAPRADAADRR